MPKTPPDGLETRIGADREALARTFESAANLYDAARPTYPDELFDDLIELAGLRPGARLLEIGCATGKATRALLERGFSIVCVEMGAQLAERARRNLAGLPLDIQIAPFEVWEGEPAAFELVYAATAWHWLDPASRYRKAYRLLRPGGHLGFWSALHAFPPGFDPFSPRSRRSMTRSARDILAHGRRLRRTKSPTIGQRSKPAACSRMSRSGATSGRGRTRRMSTSRSSTPSQATSRWRRQKGRASTERFDCASASASTNG